MAGMWHFMGRREIDAVLARHFHEKWGVSADKGTPGAVDLADFVAAIREELDPGFMCLQGSGVISTGDGTPVSGLIRVLRTGARDDRSGHVLEVAFVAHDGTLQRLTLENSALNGTAGLNRLTDHGFKLLGKASDFRHLLRSWRGAPTVRRTDRTGWMSGPGGDIYMRADGNSIPHNEDLGSAPLLVNPDHSARMRRGSLEGWQDQVARPALGSDPLVFGICAAVAAPLLKLARIETAMFNLHAKGPVGKSLAVAVATSADRAPAGSARWSLEPALLEQMIRRTHDGILALDSLPENLTGELLGHLIGLGEDGSYTQHDRDGRGVTLSTSESSFPALLKRHRTVVPAATVSRIIDIPVDIGAHGVLGSVHGHSDVRAFVSTIGSGLKAHHGHLLPAFIQRVINDHAMISHTLPARLDAAAERLLRNDRISIVAGDGARLEALRRLALVAVAGEMAIEYGLLPWPAETAEAAVLAMAVRWHSADLPKFGLDAVLQRLRTFLETSDKAFKHLSTAGPKITSDKELGWQDDTYYYLTTKQMRLVEGLSTAVPELVAQGIIVPGGQGNSWQFRMGRQFNPRPNLYRICKQKL